jgi:hypothetical protein
MLVGKRLYCTKNILIYILLLCYSPRQTDRHVHGERIQTDRDRPTESRKTQ